LGNTVPCSELKSMKDKLLLILLVGVLFGAVGWTVSAQIQRASVTRPRWEYKYVRVGAGWWDEDGRPLTGIPDAVRINAKLRDLGDQGWEMYAVSDTMVLQLQDGASTATIPVYWFKRAY
jgi:hypothetical protein